MTLLFSKPADNGGSPVTSFRLYINNGDETEEPETLVTSYDGISLTHTLVDSVDNLSIGSLYKLRFEAVNEINNSQSSQVVEYALVDKPSAP